MNVAIIGGGIVGLTTALQLNYHVRNCNVSVIAENYNHDIVSYTAPGLFNVSNSFLGPNEEITKKWIKHSYDYYNDISNNYEAIQSGVGQLDTYMFANSSPEVVQNSLIEAVVPLYRRLSEEEFNIVSGNWKYGSHFKTIVIQSLYHLPWVKNKLNEYGTKFITKKIQTLKELVNDYDIIINCSGLGARELCNDRKIIPIRGQITRVQAPEITSAFYGELDTYIIPGVDGTCTLGGTRNFESSKMEVCPYDAKSIQERCEQLMPSLKNAVTLEHKVGLRPYRNGGVRVEVEKISNDSRKAIESILIVVHNYGHGGYGVTTAPGTAQYAIELAKDFHKLSDFKL